MVVIKEIKEYERKKGTGVYNYRINISKQDKLKNKVAIFNINEYDNFKKLFQDKKNEIDVLKSKINDLKLENKKLQEMKKIDLENDRLIRENTRLIKENTELLKKVRNLEKDATTIDKLTNKFNILIKDLNTQNNNKIAELDKKHFKKIKELEKKIYEYETVLKNIVKLKFLDLLFRNEHKKLANDLLNPSPVYELTKKGIK